jgi:hypothetical protein
VPVVDLTADISIEEIIEEPTPEEASDLPAVEPRTSKIAIDNSYQIEIIYDHIPKINISFLPSAQEKSPEKAPSIVPISPTKTREKSTEEKQRNLISILKKVTDKQFEKSPTKKKSVNFLLPTTPTPSRTSPRFSERPKAVQAITNTFVLSQKFFIVIESFFSGYIKYLKFLDGSQPLLRQFFHWAKTIDIYLKLVRQSTMMSKKRQHETNNASSSTDSSAKTKKNVSSSEEYSKKLHRKLADNRSLIMHNDRNKCTIEKDCSYAYNYLERVKKTLAESGDDELYSEVMSMLTSFDPDFESVPELYHVSYKIHFTFSVL